MGIAATLVNSAGLTSKDAAIYIAAGFISQAGGHIVDNYIKDYLLPSVGSIVYCDLAHVCEHSGIYIGDGKIVHLDGGGDVEVVSHKDFLNRLGGFNPALSVYISCKDTEAIEDFSAAERAISMIGNRRNYNLVFDNCHQFTSGCITGNFENADNFWWALKNTIEKYYAVNSWRVWGSSS